MAKSTAKPKGLTITRNKNKYIFKWKKGETYADGQRLIWGYVQVTKKGNKSTKTYWEPDTVKLSGSKTDYTVSIPGTYEDITHVYFKVRGKADKKEWSDWTQETFQVKDPNAPTVTATWDSATPNKTVFSFSAKDEPHQPYNHIIWQTILVQNCPSDYKAASLWKDAEKHKKTGTSGTIYNTAEAGLTGSWARIVRACAVGNGGTSEWRYAYHVYAQPNAPYNVKVDAAYDNISQATDLIVKWDVMSPAMQRPIDVTKIQYCIGVPTTNFGLPTGASWTDIDTPVNTSLNIWQTKLYSEIQADECLFIKVTTIHDTQENSSAFVCAFKKELTTPTLGTITPTKATHSIAVAVTNGSQNPDSKIAVTYRDPETGKVGIVGVIAHGSSSMNVLVPEWIDNAGTVGAFAFVGLSGQQKSTPYYVYSVDPEVQSETVWASGTRTAPNIMAVRKDDTTVNVTYEWTWADATNAEISWADRPDAWESNVQPNTYVINNNQQANWNISGLESGKVYYFRVRLFYGENDENIYSDYSNTAVVDMTQPPEKPVLELSDTIVPVDGTVTASWQNYEKQTYAELIETASGVDTVRAEVGSGSTVEFSPADFGWSNDTQHILSVRVYLDTNTGSLKSDTVALNVAASLSCVIAQDSLVYDEQELNPETYTGNPAQLNGGTEETLREITSAKVALEPHQAGTPWQSSLQILPYLFKAAPNLNHSYNSELDSITGGSVAWNQLAQFTADKIPSNRDSLTISYTDGKSFKINGTASASGSASGWFGLSESLGFANAGGHKILITTRLVSGTITGPFRFNVTGASVETWGNSGVYLLDAGATRRFVIFYDNGVVFNNAVLTFVCTDLTQMFSSDPSIADRAYTLEQGTAGAGIAWLRSYGYFTKPYYAYDAGSIQSVCTSAHNTYGLNQLNTANAINATNVVSANNNGTISIKDVSTAQWSSTYIGYSDVIEGQEYTFDAPSMKYGRIGGSMRSDSMPQTSNDPNTSLGNGIETTVGYTTLSRRFTPYFTGRIYWYYCTDAGIAEHQTFTFSPCLHLRGDGSMDGTYEQYHKNTYALSPQELRGKLSLVNNEIKYNGDRYTADGKINRVRGRIDLGTLTWDRHQHAGTGNYYFQSNSISGALSALNTNAICGKYVMLTNTSMLADLSNHDGFLVNACVYIRDDSYSDANAFKTAMDGVYLEYPLATSTTETADPFTTPQEITPYGTEEYVDYKVAQGTRDVAIPVGHESTYADIYEVTGADEIDLYNRGINQWDEQWENGQISSVTGQPYSGTDIRSKNFCPALPSTVYYVKTKTTQYGQYTFWYDADKKFISAVQQSNGTITSPPNAAYFKIQTRPGYGTTYDNDISINLPSTDHDYHAYLGADYTASLGTTVYGGDADLVKGQGQKTYKSINLGDLNWTYRETGSIVSPYFWAYKTDIKSHGNPATVQHPIWCDRYKPCIRNQESFVDKCITVDGDVNTIGQIQIKDSAYTNADDFKKALNGAQFVYEPKDPSDYIFTAQDINAVIGQNNVWSEQGDVTVRTADAVESGYILDELPLTVTVTGAGTAGNTTMKIVRAENYAMERPDGKDYTGYEGDLIVQKVQSGEDQMTVDLANLVGRFDDGAKYRIIATIQDGLGQKSEATKDFTVQWSHQAVIATGSAVIDGDIAKITPTKPNGASDDDYVDIYRLSCDAPELIYSHAAFGDTVVDPYPTIGDTGGYRIVLVTKNGDYITVDNIPSWIDVKAGLDSLFQYIDFNGNTLPLKYNVEIDETSEKTFEITHFLGGSVQGAFLEGVEGNGTVNGVIPYDLDPDDYLTMRELKRYVGLCHVRTKNGSNYVANVQVNDGSAYNSPGHVHKVGLTIQQVDNPDMDGVLLTDWQVS